MSNWSDRKVMEDLLLAGMLVLMLVLVLMVVLRGVQPSFIARKVHVNSRRLGGHAARGTAATTAATTTGVMRVLWMVLMLVLVLVLGIMMPMVLQEVAAVGKQRLSVPVRGHGRHELQAKVAFHRLVEAPIPDAEAAVVVHIGDTSDPIQFQEPKLAGKI